MSTTNDFRTAAGLRRWPTAEDLDAPDSSALPPGPGLFEIADQDGWGHLTNVRKIAGRRRARHAILRTLVRCRQPSWSAVSIKPAPRGRAEGSAAAKSSAAGQLRRPAAVLKSLLVLIGA